MKIDSCMWYSTLITSAEKKNKNGYGTSETDENFHRYNQEDLNFLTVNWKKECKNFPSTHWPFIQVH